MTNEPWGQLQQLSHYLDNGKNYTYQPKDSGQGRGGVKWQIC